MPIYLPTPDVESMEHVALEFYRRWNVPNCIGALDGKHVIIQYPKHSGTDYFSYKKCFSLIPMATCDSYYKFNMVDIGAQGSAHDSNVFTDSAFGDAILGGRLQFPRNTNLPGTNIQFPYHLIADQAFSLNERIIRPFPGANLSEGEHITNYRISR